MIKKNIYKKIVLVNVLFVLSTLFSYAGNEVLTARVQGIDFDNAATLIVKDDKFNQLQSTPGLVNKNVINTVTLGIDPSTTIFHSTTFTITVDVDVRYLDENYSWHSIGIKTLTVDYDPSNGTSYLDKDVLTFTGGHYVEIKVLSINDGGPLSVAPDDIYLDGTIKIERYYQFSSQDIPDYTQIEHQLSHANSRELIVTWDNIEGAEEYDLEWTWVNNYDVINGGSLPTADIDFNFKNNATRVRLSATKYSIPLIYERGWILYRYRAIGIAGVDFNIPIEGVWSTQHTSVPESGVIADYDAGNRYEVLPHNNDELNWQYSATFAESGKQSTAVSYYDGTLRNRQSVAKLNTEDKVIAGSVLYDYQGRPAVNVLPSPIYKDPSDADPTAKQLSGYIENLNIGLLSGINYNKDDFDLDVGASCTSISNKMDAVNSNGAANYYSNQNSEKEGAQAFLPDAAGFPFVRTEYTNDQTGRVRRQGGLGETHQMETDHETRYLYGQPEQPELDMLFGNEAGLATHYKKNAVVDANGQVSVSYIDMHDRVVATALSGQAPSDKVIPLASNVGPQTLSTHLIDFNHPSPDNRALLVTTDILVTSVGSQTFDYSFTTEEYQECLPADICFDCIYEVTISIKDECGNDLIAKDASGNSFTFPITEMVGNINFDTDCSPIYYELDPDPITVDFPKIGTYSVYKELRVSDQPINYYTQQFIANNNCGIPYEDILASELAGLDFSGCNITACDYECLLIYPDEASYLIDFPSGVYADWLEDCVSDCNNGIANQCDLMLKELRLDFYPGGQYAAFEIDPATGSPLPSLDLYSIFYPTPTSPIENYTAITYHDASGNQIYTTHFDGTQTTPDQLLLEEFIFFFEPDWIPSIEHVHPEYCSYEFCTTNQAAYDFIEDFQKTFTFADACAKGYLNPTASASGSNFLSASCNPMINADGFFNSSASVIALIPSMNAFMDNTSLGFPSLPTGISIWRLAVASTSPCNADPDPMNCADAFFAGGGEIGDAGCNNVETWNVFKALYYQRWMQLLDAERFNGCSHPASLLPPYNKEELFPNFNDLPTTAPIGPIGSGTPGDITVMGTQICEAQASAWMNDLVGCYSQLPGGELWEPGHATYDNIWQAFVDVCVDGTVVGSPPQLSSYTGATSCPNGITLGASTVFNVDDVLTYYLGAGYENNFCSPLLITGAQPYNPNPAPLNSMFYIDNCGCDKILETEEEFALLLSLGTLPAGVSNATELLAHNLNISVTNFEQLACECSASNTDWPTAWAQGQIDDILAKGLMTDPALLCEVCISCEEFNLAITAFGNAFNGAPNHNELLTTHLNNTFGVNFIMQEYLDFYAECNAGCIAEANTINAIENFISYVGIKIDALAPYTYPISFSVPISDPYIYNLAPNYFSSCVESGSQLDFSITNTGGNYIISLISLNLKCALNCSFNINLPAELLLEDIDQVSLDWDCDGSNVITGTAQIGTGAPFDIDVSSTCITLCNCKPILCYTPIITPDDPPVDPCIAELISQAEYNAQILWEQQTNAAVSEFLAGYYEKCMLVQETFDKTFSSADHHYTLYYYDQAGNLTKTVPPKGINKLTSTTAVEAHRDDPLANPAVLVNHDLKTEYLYNAYNQVVKQYTPDAGLTRYFYDNIGRLVVSQNSKQANILGVPHKYSYTLYDEHGRITEVGEATTSLVLDNTTAYKTQIWLADVLTTDREQVTKTFYDEELSTAIAAEFGVLGQQNLRNRIASVTYRDVYDAAPSAYENATHYSYDEHGNVLTSVQENRELTSMQNEFKRTDYTYELISGNIVEVAYQQGEPDQFFHRYFYDADNRLFEVETSKDHVIWDREAKYKYYEHGPLARTETGDLQVQGTDYAYTIQGWLKGVNSNTLVENRDMGKDGIKDNTVVTNQYMTAEPNQHALMGRDAFGFSLDYFMGDYTAVSTPPLATNFLAEITTGSLFETRTRRDLFNGNITAMTNAITKPDGSKMDINSYAYQYDQLNRLKQMDTYTGSIGSNNNYSGAAITPDYFVSLDYDPNGNITDLIRKATTQAGGQLKMDNMDYNYIPGTNQLDFVFDHVLTSPYNDIKDGQVTGNYQYTDIGELKSDVAEQIENIEWTVYGKVKRVTRTPDPVTSPATKPSDLEFVYGPSGQRIVKIEKPRTLGGDLKTQEFWKYTYYVYDASGNLMATYDKRYEVGALWSDINVKFNVNEHPIYGSSRLGLANEDITLFDQDFNIINYNSDLTFVVLHGSETTPILASVDLDRTTRVLGKKMYELSNHLGNVQVVVSDRKLSTEDGTTGTIDFYEADVVSASDYYPFGMLMPGRNFSSPAYRYGFNGMEKDDEMKSNGNSYDFGARQYDPRLGKFMSLDFHKYRYAYWSPYSYAANSPLRISDDGFGPDDIIAQSYTGSGNLIIYLADYSNLEWSTSMMKHQASGWDYVVVTDLTDAANWVQEFYGDNNKKAIQNLYIRTHGSTNTHRMQVHEGGYDSDTPPEDYHLGAVDFNNYDPNDLSKIQNRQINAIQKIGSALGENASVGLAACTVGENERLVRKIGESLISEENTRIYIFANRDYSQTSSVDDEYKTYVTTKRSQTSTVKGRFKKGWIRMSILGGGKMVQTLHITKGKLQLKKEGGFKIFRVKGKKNGKSTKPLRGKNRRKDGSTKPVRPKSRASF